MLPGVMWAEPKVMPEFITVKERGIYFEFGAYESIRNK